MPRTAREIYYPGKTFAEIKDINPFCEPSWLKDSSTLTNLRAGYIETLFNGKNRVSAIEIKQKGTNEGKHAAFMAILHGKAVFDGNGGLIRNTAQTSPDPEPKTNIPEPTRQKVDIAVLLDNSYESQPNQKNIQSVKE